MANWNGGNWIRKDKRLAIYLRDDFRCVYCGEDLRAYEPRDITLDHLECRCNGGGNKADNLVTACRSCNSSRQDKPWREYATGGSILRIEKLTKKRLTPFRKMAKAIIAGNAGDPTIENRFQR